MGWSALRKFPTVFYCIFSASCTLTLMMMLMLSPSMLLHCSQKLMQKSKRKIIEINESCIFATFHSHSVYMCVFYAFNSTVCRFIIYYHRATIQIAYTYRCYVCLHVFFSLFLIRTRELQKSYLFLYTILEIVYAIKKLCFAIKWFISLIMHTNYIHLLFFFAVNNRTLCQWIICIVLSFQTMCYDKYAFNSLEIGFAIIMAYRFIRCMALYSYRIRTTVLHQHELISIRDFFSKMNLSLFFSPQVYLFRGKFLRKKIGF